MRLADVYFSLRLSYLPVYAVIWGGGGGVRLLLFTLMLIGGPVSFILLVLIFVFSVAFSLSEFPLLLVNTCLFL